MRVENTSERQIDLSAKDLPTVSIPRGHGGDDGKQNGAADVPDELLAALAADKFTMALFASGDLVKGKAAPAPAGATHTDDRTSKPTK